MEFEKHSSGTAKAGLATGIVGTSLASLGLLSGNGVLGGLIGGMPTGAGAMGCTRELMEKDLKISELSTDVKFRDSVIYADRKSIDLYKYIDGQINGINAQLAQQAVQNQATKDSFQLLNERLCCEQKERKCSDATLVNYMNATFYPKLVSDISVGTTTTAQTLYNPLPVDNCCC